MPLVPGAAPESTWGKRANATVVSIYLLAWAFVGLSCLIVGVMLNPEISSTVADIGTAWLGLAGSQGFSLRPAPFALWKVVGDMEPWLKTSWIQFAHE